MPADPRSASPFSRKSRPASPRTKRSRGAGEIVEVALGTFTDTIRFVELNPLDGGTSEKIYARGTGLLVDDPIERIAN